MGDVFWMLEQLLSSIEYPEQQSMRCRRVRPTNAFVKFKKEEIEQSIPDRFERQVDRYPDHIAVKTSSHELSYDALNKAANRVARAILEQTREGEEPIALLLEHGAPVITAILGVLKAAKIYVPLDPSYPRVRIAYMLEDSQAGLIVTDNKNFPLARELTSHALQALNVDEMDSGLSTENLGLFISPDTTAYILYTSGSTGQPKGVVQNHCNVLHQVRTYTNDFHICADDRQSLLISCSFAAAVKIVFSTLLNGAALFPFDLKEEGVANLANWLIQEEITIYFSVPTTFRRFVSTLTGEDKFPKLRLVSLGGEPVCKRHVDMYKKHFSSGCLLGNRLGSTETQSIRWYFMDKKTQINGNMVPVGYAIEDVEVLLLDDAGEDVGFNRVGEITVKSRYLSPGYWRRPDLTRAAFLPDPEGGDERVYRTGDLALMRPDGCLMHLGRKDFQVKIRGHRIEVAEIEMALLNLDTIKDAVVLALEDQRGDKRLVAYLVPARQPAPTVSELRRALAETLPDYMIPLAFVMLDTLPLTPTGKVDRRVLPAPATARPELENPFVAPRTPVEETLVNIWSQVLGLDQVGIHDNFFDLGGHSLLATQVISRVLNTFRLEASLRSLFQAPTVADMAVVISQSWVEKAGREDIDRMLAELEALSDEEARRLLADERAERRK